jgi:hypothetical protein
MTRYVPMTESLRLCALGTPEAGAGSVKESRNYPGVEPSKPVSGDAAFAKQVIGAMKNRPARKLDR